MKKLDPRIKDRKCIFDCFSSDKAKDYIGKQCYMTDDFDKFSNLDDVGFGTLYEIDDYFKSSPDDWFTFCLPVEFVVPKEKKFRPYTFEEFCNKFTVGRPIKFRRNGSGYEWYLILNGYKHEHEQYNDQTITYIYIGAFAYTLQELFEGYEWQEHYTEDFKPFGVEE